MQKKRLIKMKAGSEHKRIIVRRFEREKIVRFILTYLKGDMTDEQKKEFDEWLDEDEGNRELFHRLQDEDYVREGLREFQGYDSLEDWKNVQARLRVSRRKVGGWIRGFAASVTIMLCVGLAWYFMESRDLKRADSPVIEYGRSKAILFLSSGKVIELESSRDTILTHVEGESIVNDGKKLMYTDTVKEKSVEWHTLQVPRGGEFVLCLSDGTVVTLNADSKIHYPNHFTGNERQVSLEGEAFFEVAKDSSRPFMVKMNDLRVQVLGTSFNVESYQNENDQITLVTGSVEVIGKNRKVVLIPGEQATKEGDDFEVRKVDAVSCIAWTKQRMVFDNEPMDKVLKKLQRWYDFDLVVEGESLGSIRFTGDLPKYEELDKVLEVLRLTTDVSFKLNQKVLSVKKE